MNEAETRAEHIDPALKAAGWGVVEGSRVRRKGEMKQPQIKKKQPKVQLLITYSCPKWHG
jgi:type I site-specific restriction endonuclease